jgi:EpsI family protein
VALLGLTLLLSQGLEFKERVPVKVSFSQFPLQVGPWSGTRKALEREYLEELALSDYLLADYTGDDQAWINLYIAYSASQKKGKSSHSPATCLPGGGWNFKESGLVAVPLANGESRQVARVVMEKNGSKQVAYYWFPQRGRTLTNLNELKLYTFWDSMISHRSDGALVRIITPVAEGASTETADARLKAFIKVIAPRLDTFIPGKNLT